MKPWVKAYEIAVECGVSPEEYEERMGLCVRDGYIFSTPDEFMAAHDAEHNGEPAYFILSAVGGSGNVLARFLRYAPEPKPWVLWCRNNEQRIRAFRWDKLARKAGLK
jgi:hypothetical protein